MSAPDAAARRPSGPEDGDERSPGAAGAAPGVPAARRSAFRARLLAWWDAGHRALPWRFAPGRADPYRVWVSEVMLQQTQVATVVPYYRRFLERFPTLERLAAADEDEVLALWSGLGYYGRGRRLRAAAREALARHGGLPASAEALAALPGFGRYTAGAVASIAFGQPVPCVDGNAARVLARAFLVDDPPETPAAARRLWAIAAALVAPDRPGDLNQALMELGATVCAKRAPACRRCPIAAVCAARRAGREREVPPARARTPARRLDVACAVVRWGGAYLLERRPPGGLFGGLWELPSVEVTAGGGGAPASLGRALRERLGVRVRVGAPLASIDRTLTHRRLRLTAYECRPGGAAARHLASLARGDGPAAGVRLSTPEGLGAAGMSTAMRRLIDTLARSP